MREFVAEPCTTDLYELGEGCRWDEVRDELYWVDVPTGRFFRARADGPRVDLVATYELGGLVTSVAPYARRDDGWLVARDQSVYRLDQRGDLCELASPEARQAPEVRMNDGAVDPWGSFWVGSMALDASPGRGSLYRFSERDGVETVVEHVTISNGVGWSPDSRTMYYVDSGPGTVRALDVDELGRPSRARPFVNFDVPREGTPDGLCVDVEGAVWVAVWGGRQVRRYAATGELLARVHVDASQPSCCALGGADGTTLYVTTAREDLSEDVLAGEPDAGRLFCVDVGVRGLPLGAYRPTPRKER